MFVSHGAWAGNEYGMGEFNEQRLPDVEVLTGLTFDYIALGHYHRYVAVKDHACYSGSTERTSLNEHNSACGYLIVDLETGARTFHTIHTRHMVKLPIIDCADLTTTAIYKRLRELATPDCNDAIVQLVLTNIEDETFLALDIREIDEIFKVTFYLEKQLSRVTTESNRLLSHSKIESLPVEFERFLNTIDNKELDKRRIAELGAFYLDTA